MTSSDNAEKQFFTIDEANLRLPLVKAIVKDIVELHSDVQERRDRLATVRRSRGDSGQDVNRMYSEEVDQIELDILSDEKQLNEYVSELKQLGIEFKDPVMGLVDFPSLMDGNEVCLCWKLGEPEVQYWHESGSGFAGRQSLLQDELSITGGPNSEEEE
jgi:hypothetical protein